MEIKESCSAVISIYKVCATKFPENFHCTKFVLQKPEIFRCKMSVCKNILLVCDVDVTVNV